MKYLSILGSTGSIGRQTLEVVSQFPERFKVLGLGAGKNVSLLKEQILTFKPKWVCMLDKERAEGLKKILPKGIKTEILYGEEGYVELATRPEVSLVVSAMLGISGLKPTLAAIKAEKTVALANKEALVTGGNLIKKAIKREDQLLPVDSEHSAIFQLLSGRKREEVKHIILTASGGPFWERKVDLSRITPQEAIQHPRWSMGAKISVDSATLMNKGLEVIEAMWLFDLGLERIKILIHPQSLVHSLVEFKDGTIFAHLSQPDMKLPIAFALNYPERLELSLPPLNLWEHNLSFFPPDFERFPCLKLALKAAKIGGSMPVVLNAANEVAVESFLGGKIGFTDIPRLIEAVMQMHKPIKDLRLETIFAIDNWARKETMSLIETGGNNND